MKKVAIILAAGILSLTVTSSAFAQNSCGFMEHALKNNGFTTNAAYTAEGILGLLKDVRVEPKELSTLKPTERYRLEYSCDFYNQAAHSRLVATPLNDGTGDMITTIHWVTTQL